MDTQKTAEQSIAEHWGKACKAREKNCFIAQYFGNWDIFFFQKVVSLT